MQCFGSPNLWRFEFLRCNQVGCDSAVGGFAKGVGKKGFLDQSDCNHF